jgi:hypothetical protein
MPYEVGLAIVGAAQIVVIETLAYVLVKARALKTLFRR